MADQSKPRKRIIDFIADAFDEFFGGQELHRARNALMPPPPPTGSGELVTPPLLAALKEHPDLHALVTARDAFGRAKYGTGLRCHNGRNPLEDARQELGDLLQYLWQATMEGRDITHALDQMARAISVLQGGKR